MTESGKKLIAMGITGGIAAYKAADLCSTLAKKYDVQVIMTESSQEFVGELTFRTLSRRPVIRELFAIPAEVRPAHVALADEADLFIVVPATANFLAKYANGIADDALSTFAATWQGKTILAPAMNPKMWNQPACQRNVDFLKQQGVIFAGPVSGRVACGADGVGRMMDISDISDIIDSNI